MKFPSSSLASRLAALGLTALLFGLSAPAQGAEVLLPDFPVRKVTGETVLFAFDPLAFPFGSRVQTHLLQGTFHSVVMASGAPGTADELVGLYGSVVRIGDTFHMWYSGKNGPESPSMGYGFGLRLNQAKFLCYARSTDGIHWEKPALGLVNYQGSTANNMVLVPGSPLGPPGVVLYDPADPDPARRFKLAYEAYVSGRNHGQFCVAFSADGLRWTPSAANPVGAFFEMSGISRFNGKYYVCGQDDSHLHQTYTVRTLVTFVSADFEHWSPCGAPGLPRLGELGDLNGPSIEKEGNIREEVHLGAALWNRGDVLVGIYGQFHGNAMGDRRLVAMDLGLTLTHDGVHHVEPIPGFKLIPAHEQPGSPAGDVPALIQGQGMENVGDKTYYWYSLWRTKLPSGIRLATWERDRLGMLKPIYAGAPASDFQAVSCAFALTAGGSCRLFLNTGGLGPQTNLRVTLLDATFRPLPGYTAVVAQSGLRVPIAWANGQAVRAELGEVHVQIQFEGVRPEDGSLYALYIDPIAAP